MIANWNAAISEELMQALAHDHGACTDAIMQSKGFGNGQPRIVVTEGTSVVSVTKERDGEEVS